MHIIIISVGSTSIKCLTMLLDRAAEEYWKKSEREGESNSRWKLVERLRCWEMAGVNSGLERDFLQPCV